MPFEQKHDRNGLPVFSIYSYLDEKCKPERETSE